MGGGQTGLKTNSRRWCLEIGEFFPKRFVFSDWRHNASQLFPSPAVCQCVRPSSSCASDAPAGAADVYLIYVNY